MINKDSAGHFGSYDNSVNLVNLSN